MWRRALLVLPAIVLLAAWQLFATIADLSFFLGDPIAVGIRLGREVSAGTLLRDVWVTGQQAAAGLLLGATLGGIAGVTLALQSTIRRIMTPYVDALGVIPPIAFGPIAVLLLGTGFQMKVGFAALSAGLVMLGYAFVGGGSLDRRLLEFVQTTPHEKHRVWMVVLLPAFSAWIVGGLRAALAAALVGTFVGQILSASEGLGYRIQRSLGLFDIEGVWVGIIGFAFLGLVMTAGLAVASDLWMRRVIHHVRD
jgi:NitT/TauT family transport system permease protein